MSGLRTLEESAEEEVAFLRRSELVRPELKERIRGFVYDIKTGGLKATMKT